MSFSLPRFLRRMQSSDLQRYFATRDISFPEQVDWTVKPVALLVSLKAAIEALPERERERVFEDFERIDQVSDEIGQRALRSLIEHDEAFSIGFIPATAAKHAVYLCFLEAKRLSITHLQRRMPSACAMVAAGADIAFQLLSPRAKAPPISLVSKQTSARYFANSTAPVES
jgi:hypothetical protein